MEIIEIKENKLDYIDLLFLGDEDIDMINKYVEKSSVYLLNDKNKNIAIVAILEYDKKTLEIKNIAVDKKFQKKGYGKKLIEFIENKYKDQYKYLILGTGDSPLTIPFYEKLGFEKYKVLKDFFTINYKEEIVESGVVLKDMIYLKKKIGE